MDAALERMEVGRSDLHKRVWSAPLPSVAEELGVSEATLRRLSTLLDVRLPKRDHWQRERKPRTPVLLPRTKGEPDGLWLVRRGRGWSIEMDGARPAPRPRRASSLHPVVARAAALYAHPTLGPDGLMRTRRRDEPKLAVSEASRDRSLALADALVRLLEAEGWTVTWKGELAFARPEGAVPLSIRERVERADGPPPWELPERPSVRAMRLPRARSHERPTGELCLYVASWCQGIEESVTREWCDEAGRPLESCLEELPPALLAYLRAAEMARKGADLERTRQEEAWGAQEEARRLEEIEKARRARLDAEIAAWKRAADIREYADELEAAHRQGPGGGLTGEVEEWLAWMRRRADEADPTCLSARPPVSPSDA